MVKTMKYSELNVGDNFKIAREGKGGCIYVKHEFYFSELLDPKKSYRKLKGDVVVERIIL